MAVRKLKREAALKVFDKLAMPHIDAGYDDVAIEGVVVKRPQRLSVSQWLGFWEQMLQD